MLLERLRLVFGQEAHEYALVLLETFIQLVDFVSMIFESFRGQETEFLADSDILQQHIVKLEIVGNRLAKTNITIIRAAARTRTRLERGQGRK